MRALTSIIVLSLIVFCTSSVVQGEEIEHKYGIELRGGYGLYLNNSDPNDFAENFTGISGYSQTEFNESTGAITGGLSLLYKSKDYWTWHIGLNILGTDSTTALAQKSGDEDQQGRVYFNTVELFFTGNYYWNLTPRFNIHIGGGPAFYLASMDREALGGAEIQYGESFYGAHGRAFGFIGTLGAELFLSDAVALKLGGGFRYALVDRFKYIIETSTGDLVSKKGQIAYWPDSFDTFEVDFTGAFLELGLRIYFEPVTKWMDYDR